MSGTTLAVRLDSLGDVLVTSPALRALAAGSRRVVLLAGPRGRAAAEMLPGVDEVLVWACPWIEPEPPPVDSEEIEVLVGRVRELGAERAVVFSSYHQSPLPVALLLRMAGIGHVAAISEDYPGSLLDVRHRTTDDQHEVHRALGLARAAGFELPPGDDGAPRVRGPLVRPRGLPEAPYVVVHPGTSVPARGWFPDRYAEVVRMLATAGHLVLVTGAPDERVLTRGVAGCDGVDLGGRTTWPELAAVLAGASAVVVGNTGPAHLAAAVGAPVVSLFAPTVPAVRWAPYADARVVLGDQDAICRDTRVTDCPFPGHPCLASVTPAAVVRAVDQLHAASVRHGSRSTPEEVEA